jgi:hypothetical protein
MRGLTKFLLIVLILALAGGTIFLATWDIPAPSSTIEKTLPDDRFPR